jgi:hypothetical protein
MEEKREIIIDINVDAKDFNKEIGEVNKQLLDNRNKIKELSKDYAGNATEIAKLETENKKLSASKSNLLKQNTAEANSLNGLRAKLAALTKQRNETNVGTEEGAKAFKKLQLEIGNTTTKIKGYEEEAGDFRRNVGNYKNSILEAAGSTGAFGKSVGSMGAVLKMNPIFLLVTVLGAVISKFKESQSGLEAFRVVGAAFNVVFGKLSDIIEAIGNRLITLKDSTMSFSDIMKNLGDVILTNLQNRFKSVLVLGEAISLLFDGEFAAAAKKGADAVIQMSAGIENGTDKIIAAGNAIGDFVKEVSAATQEASRLESMLLKLEINNKNLEVSFAKQRLQLVKYREVFTDVTKSFDERRKAAEKAIEIENKELALRVKNQEALVRILKAQNNLTNSTEEDIQRVRDAEIQLFKLQEESYMKQIKIKTTLNGLTQQEAAINAAAAAQRIKDAELEDAAYVKLQQGRIQRQIDEINKSKELTQEDNETKARLLEEQLSFEYALKIENAALTNEELLNIDEQYKADLLKIQEKSTEDEIKLKEKSLKQEEQINKARRDSALSVISASIQIASDLFSKNEALQKSFAVGEATVNLAKELSNSAVNASSPVDPANIVTGGAAAPVKFGALQGLAVARYGVNIGNILGAFYTGGYTGSGGKYEPKGVVHGGEFVFDKESTSTLGVKNLEAMQKSARGYAMGGMVGKSATYEIDSTMNTSNMIGNKFKGINMTVGVTEINKVQRKVNVSQNTARL